MEKYAWKLVNEVGITVNKKEKRKLYTVMNCNWHDKKPSIQSMNMYNHHPECSYYYLSLLK